ncbi:MAG: nuclear transport factor 2 family protein [Bacteroidia bacterium]|nr:nuclear transport factor 2 family protein [Bacteroidia bacterium]
MFGQTSEQPTIDLKKARIIIDSLDKQFSKYYFEGDSVALAAMYAKDGSFGSLKGNDILSAMGKNIRDAFKNNTRTIIYTTTSLSTDSEFLVETGIYEVLDDTGNSKGKGKYLVVWKQENGDWKLYRDIGL